jgi:arsenate reductase
MAEGLLRHQAPDRFDVFSAGTKPSHLRPEAIAVMQEIGIDISRHHSKSVDDFLGQKFDYVVTVCDNANATCPVFPGPARRLHWPFEDPASVQGSEEERKAAFRKIRDQIGERIAEFTASSGTYLPAASL